MHYPWSSLKSDDETDTDDSAYDAGDLDSDEEQLQTEENQLLELQDKKNIWSSISINPKDKDQLWNFSNKEFWKFNFRQLQSTWNPEDL